MSCYIRYNSSLLLSDTIFGTVGYTVIAYKRRIYCLHCSPQCCMDRESNWLMTLCRDRQVTKTLQQTVFDAVNQVRLIMQELHHDYNVSQTWRSPVHKGTERSWSELSLWSISSISWLSAKSMFELFLAEWSTTGPGHDTLHWGVQLIKSSLQQWGLASCPDCGSLWWRLWTST
jgi:hypothetical protein